MFLFILLLICSVDSKDGLEDGPKGSKDANKVINNNNLINTNIINSNIINSNFMDIGNGCSVSDMTFFQNTNAQFNDMLNSAQNSDPNYKMIMHGRRAMLEIEERKLEHIKWRHPSTAEDRAFHKFVEEHYTKDFSFSFKIDHGHGLGGRVIAKFRSRAQFLIHFIFFDAVFGKHTWLVSYPGYADCKGGTAIYTASFGIYMRDEPNPWEMQARSGPKPEPGTYTYPFFTGREEITFKFDKDSKVWQISDMDLTIYPPDIPNDTNVTQGEFGSYGTIVSVLLGVMTIFLISFIFIQCRKISKIEKYEFKTVETDYV